MPELPDLNPALHTMPSLSLMLELRQDLLQRRPVLSESSKDGEFVAQYRKWTGEVEFFTRIVTMMGRHARLPDGTCERLLQGF
jgi:hypothetical protein